MTNVDITKPIVWTSRGNVNEDTLVKESHWHQYDTEFGPVIKHVLIHRDPVTKEIVKEGAWVLASPLAAAAIQGQLGGNGNG